MFANVRLSFLSGLCISALSFIACVFLFDIAQVELVLRKLAKPFAYLNFNLHTYALFMEPASKVDLIA